MYFVKKKVDNKWQTITTSANLNLPLFWNELSDLKRCLSKNERHRIYFVDFSTLCFRLIEEVVPEVKYKIGDIVYIGGTQESKGGKARIAHIDYENKTFEVKQVNEIGFSISYYLTDDKQKELKERYKDNVAYEYDDHLQLLTLKEKMEL